MVVRTAVMMMKTLTLKAVTSVLKLCGDDDTYIKDMGTFNGYVSSGDDG
jgi:uncharacterized protein (UPF0548 family)